MACILVISNYDSFVYNIVSYLTQIGADVTVWRNDNPWLVKSGWKGAFDGVLLSSDPGTPERAGVCVEMIRRLGEHKPLFGVCLGFRAMAVALGGVVDRIGELLHDEVSPMTHGGKRVSAGLPSPLRTTRYHSLAAVEDKLPEELKITARTESGVVMAVHHREWPIEVVQLRPESALTKGGYQMLAN